MRSLDQQDLIATDTEMAVGDELQLGGIEMHCLRDSVDDDEIVAEAMHLGEAKSHAR